MKILCETIMKQAFSLDLGLLLTNGYKRLKIYRRYLTH